MQKRINMPGKGGKVEAFEFSDGNGTPSQAPQKRRRNMSLKNQQGK